MTMTLDAARHIIHNRADLNEAMDKMMDRLNLCEDLLSSALAIAERKGEDTDWENFANRLQHFGISGVTAKVFKMPPGTTLPASPLVTPLDVVLFEIKQELSAAIAKFPHWPVDPFHAVSVLGEEYGELVRAVNQEAYEHHKQDRGAVRIEAIQTAAMCLRFLLAMNEYKWHRSQRVEQATLVAP